MDFLYYLQFTATNEWHLMKNVCDAFVLKKTVKGCNVMWFAMIQIDNVLHDITLQDYLNIE
jgi:hypothetical protein